MIGQPDPRRAPLKVEGKRYIIRDHMAAVIQLVLALASARTLGWYNAWLYASVLLAVKVSSALILSRVNPAVLNARGTRHAMSVRDRIFFSVFIPSALAIPIVAGVDVGVAGWTHRSDLELAVGLALVLSGASLVVWAIAVNAFFETTVRIQHDRGQRVCTSGPYRFVRHPGYTGAIAATSGVPLALGSYWCFVPVVVMTLAFIARTADEDRLLRAELDGYDVYAARTGYRLCPFVW
jgi:protein-S-isoprenylcysteine O-methyltransferase Ste14